MGFPKTIATGQDLYNCLAMAKVDTLAAKDLQEKIEGLEARAFLHCPIVGISEDRKTVKIRYCGEVQAGQMVNGVEVSGVSHSREVEDLPQGDDDTSTTTEIKLQTPFPADTDVVLVPNPVDPLEKLGITRAQFEAIKTETIQEGIKQCATL